MIVRILLIHRYFWPDTPPYATMLRVIANRLAADGHEVEVFTAQPSYTSLETVSRQKSTEYMDGVRVRRVALLRERGRKVLFRLFNMLYFPLAIFIHSVFKGRFHVIMASTAPPVVVGASAALGAKLTGAKFIYHCMDIHPEIGAISGEFERPTIFQVLSKIDQWTCRQAKKVIVLSKDMENALRERPDSAGIDVEIINNFELRAFNQIEAGDWLKALLKEKGKYRLLFAGNIGRFQQLEAFVDAMELLTNRPDIELVFLGEGSALQSLKNRAAGKIGKQIRFFSHQSVEVARRIMQDADLGIVSLMKGVYRYAYPSKIMTYVAEGLPLLVSIEENSELAAFVREEDIGLLVTPGNPVSIAEAVDQAFRSPILLEKMSMRAKETAKEMFSPSVALPRWSTLIGAMADER